jgi:hypothetical protein
MRVTLWKPIPGYEGLYQVSENGEVLSARRATTRGGLLRRYPDGLGYLYVTLTREGAQKRFAVHRLVALSFIGPCPAGQEVRHLDGNSANPSLANLAYGTHTENMQDMVRHGTSSTGRKTHCPAGHPYDEANTRIYDGRRWCRQCVRDRSGYKGNPLPGDRTHCPQGHPYDEENTYRANGKRQCRTCKQERLQSRTAGPCSVDGCGKPEMARGWCTMHYARWRKHGDPLHATVREIPACSEDECDRVSMARGLCLVHYKRKWKAGELPPLTASV